MTHVAFLGLGAMGTPMARRILSAGFPLTVWNRHPERARAIAGATVARSPREAAAAADVVCTMLADPAALKAVAEGPDGLVAGLSSGKIWLDFSTVTPVASRRAAELAREKGADFCDVPVAGSVKPAADGTLKLLAGGDEAVLARAKKVLDAVSVETLHFGGVGQGSAMKLVNNLTFGVALATFGEAVRLAARLGLPEQRVTEWLLAAPSTSPYVQRKVAFLEGGGRPPQFSLSLMEKDLRLALEAGGGELPVVEGACADLRAAAAAGFGAEDFSWVIPHLAGTRPGSK
jgi:3-hydroxyisobutyrate dehydrogenase-like beta-hydroxyacid dehydrogenase